MKAEQAKKLVDEGLAELATALEQGKSESLTAYLATMAKFHRYSFGNIMLIMSQKPDATHVAGFRSWKKLGRFVKKGEKGIVIIAPMMIRPKDDASTGDNGEDRTLIRFKAAYVFDVSQTDGEPLPEPASACGNPNGHTERLTAFILGRGIKLEYADDLGEAFGSSSGGLIRIRKDLQPAEEFMTLSHELAHELLHHEPAERAAKKIRETEAEAVAFVVAQAIGLDAGTASSDYIQLYAGDKETLAGSLGRIQQTASAILEAIMNTSE